MDLRGFEPLTLGLQSRCSTTELQAQVQGTYPDSRCETCPNATPRKWCAGAGSNRRPHDYQSCALAN